METKTGWLIFHCLNVISPDTPLSASSPIKDVDAFHDGSGRSLKKIITISFIVKLQRIHI